ncbi:MAG: hypothetical protein BGO57_12670 [Sphingomonadales bacterium 63-6]|nr:MAG: hypothetical protein BGO57_12670 [Sphingomonadales bacterium 63-6]
MTVIDELARELAVIRSGHDILPFMTNWIPTSEAEFRMLPEDMLAIIRSSPDYRELVPGAPPARLQFSAGDEGAELVIYRALADRRHYMLAPSRRG